MCEKTADTQMLPQHQPISLYCCFTGKQQFDLEINASFAAGFSLFGLMRQFGIQ